MFSEEDNTSVGIFTRRYQGFFSYVFIRKGKVVGWVNSGDMTHIYSFKKYLQFFVQDFHASKFFVSHYYMSVLISLIFVFSSRERHWWTHLEDHYT